MKNIIKLFGIIALVAVIGFSVIACEGPAGPKGDPGDVLSYIPAESGLRGSVWNQNGGSYKITFSNDGYSVEYVSTSPYTYLVGSYGKRPDGTQVIFFYFSAVSISGSTLTYLSETYTRLP